jgi:Cu/Ag efflux protein CusF
MKCQKYGRKKSKKSGKIMCLSKFLKIFSLSLLLFFTQFACDSENKTEEVEKRVFKGVGVVKAVDQEKSLITLDHEKIEGLMSAMTMDFTVGDKKLLDRTRVGDKVGFELEKKEAEIVVVKIKKIGEVAVGARGSEIYKTNCAECHGEKGGGVEDKGISFLEGHALHHEKEDFINRVTNGKEDEMPAFRDKLSKEEIKEVVDYVRNEIQSKVKKKEDNSHQH